MTLSLFVAACGWSVERLNVRDHHSLQLMRPRGIECDGCRRDGITWYREGGVEGPLCLLVVQRDEEEQATPRRARRRTKTTVGDEDRMGREQRTLF